MRKNIKDRFEGNGLVICALGIGVILATGILIGAKVQNRVDMRMIAKRMKDTMVIAQEINPPFPDTMSIPEIKELLSTIEGSQFRDALITNVKGVKHLIIR